jgi:hypothetical protein
MIVAVMVRETWTDERLDDLNKKVDNGFDRVDRDIRELRSDMKYLHQEMNERFDALMGRLLAGFLVLIAALIGSTATLAGIAIF